MQKIIKISAILLSLSTVFSVSAIEVTPFIGYRFGGDFDVNSAANDGFSTIKVHEETSYGLLVAWPYEKKQQGEFLISHYNTNFTGAPLNSNESLLSDTGLGISYFHLGGNVPISGGALPLWVTGGLGLTHLSPDDSELTDETRFSLNIGLNTQLAVSENISLRLGGRIYGTFFNSDSAIFCGTEACKVYISSSLWIQSEVNAGLTFKF